MEKHRRLGRAKPLILGIAFVLSIVAFTAVITSAANITLNLLHCWDGVREPWVNEMLADFEAAYPGVKVVPQLTSCNTLREKTTIGIASNTLADVAMIHSDQIPTIYTSLLKVDNYMQNEGINRNIWYPSEIAQGEWKSSLYAFPIRTGGDNNHILFWNKQIFEEVGLDGEQPPVLWSDLEAVSKKVVRYDADKIVRGAINFSNQPERELGWLYTGGGTLLNDEATQITLGTQAARDTLSFFRSLLTSVYRSPQDAHQMGEQNMFATGRTAMHAKGAATVAPLMESNPELRFGMAVVPRLSTEYPSGVHAGTYLYAISANSKYPNEAWELMKWLTIRQESAGYFMLRQGRPSPVRRFNSDPRYLDINPYWHVIGEGLQLSASIPLITGIADYIKGWQQAFTAVVFNGDPIESTLQNTTNTLQARLNENLAKK
jgi:ABC-type glycerol-3-phosphate transport system substrate-binding protein